MILSLSSPIHDSAETHPVPIPRVDRVPRRIMAIEEPSALVSGVALPLPPIHRVNACSHPSVLLMAVLQDLHVEIQMVTRQMITKHAPVMPEDGDDPM